MSAIASEIVDPYAEALMSLAQEKGLTDRFGEDLTGLHQALESSEDLRRFLANPTYSTGQKREVIRQLCEGRVNDYIYKFLMLLVDRQRIIFLSDIAKRYQAQLRELKRIVLAEITVAVEMTSSQRDAVTNRVMQMTSAQGVELDVQVDPSILGGVIIKVGSQVLDASLRGQLRRIGVNLSRATA